MQALRGDRGSVMMEYVILVATLALLLFAGNNYLTNDAWLENELFVNPTTGAGPNTFGKDVAGMYQRVMAGLSLPTP